ncbi:MAG: hypothetical protein HOJ62_08910 [Planctomycetaceae bacterium]|nr:hypothetical protein [Planctomycetaceae bacterium]
MQIATKEVHDYNKIDVRDNISIVQTDICFPRNDRKTIDMEAEAYKSAQYEYPPHKPSLFIAMHA